MVVEDGTKKVFQFWGKTWWDKSHSALLNYNEPPTWETNFLEETKKRGFGKNRLALASMFAAVAPVLQVMPVVGFALRNTVSPSHKLRVEAAVMVGATGRGFMVTTTGADNGAGQPLKSMVLTENVPEEFTVILCETWPVFQR